MKTFRLAVLVATLSCLGLVSAPAETAWLSNFQKAQTEAKASHKLLLLNFTGSDWCIWCKKLDAEVFALPAFQSLAKDHLVLVTVDFPRGTALAPEVKKQNEELAAKYHVEGFPTIVILNPEGKQVGLFGYEPNGAGAFLKELQRLTEG